MNQPPVEYFISFSRWTGEQLSPYLAIAEEAMSQILPHEYLKSITSKHAENLPLMNPVHVLLIVAAYLLMVILGKSIMSNFKRVEMSLYSLCHNFSMVVLSAYMVTEVVKQAYIGKYSLFGNPADETLNGWPMAKIIWLFYFSKILEFNDTFIMIMKKNNRQISFLHVYHHASIFTIWWFVTLMAPNGEAYFSAALNSFIHVIMYGYYFLSSLGVQWVQIIKPFITRSQMFQFCLMMIQATYDIGIWLTSDGSKNVYPATLSILLWVYMVSMLGLFYNFYSKDRQRAKLAKQQKKE